ncbi:hypothetical protein [Burkholderia ubonensis]|uniref:hypothetical protein n=1 Tax=Burkholderia ubonensis TaxID=101571 RepID=UPI0012F71EED|nr:hypothetical protein [Burkholderia ubonensis]
MDAARLVRTGDRCDDPSVAAVRFGEAALNRKTGKSLETMSEEIASAIMHVEAGIAVPGRTSENDDGLRSLDF